jgi:hypothetical protein
LQRHTTTMNEKPTNNIDDIFKSSLESIETEPSEGFWIKASEDALFKSNLAKRSELNKWKTTAYILGAAIVALAIYLIYSEEELSGVKKQLNKFQENTVVQSKSKKAVQNSEQVAVNNNKENPVAQVREPLQKKATTNTSIILSSSIAVNTGKKNIAPRQHIINNAIQSGVVNSTNSEKSYSSNTTNDDAVSQVLQQSPSSDIRQNTTDNSGKEIKNNSVTTENKTNTDIVNTEPETQTPIALRTNRADSTNAIAVDGDQKPVGNKSIWSKFSASIFYAPYISDELFESESADNTTINNETANEEEVNPYMLGARFGYDISSKWSIVTGLYYYSFQVAVSPITIYAQQRQSGDVGYSLQTSMGTVECEYNGTPNVGDAMKVNGTATAHYLSIPFQIKYSFINSTKFIFYLTGGAAVNMVAYRKMSLHWQDFNWNEGDELEGIESSESIYYSFYAAPGISYKFNKCFSVYFEPSIMGSPTFLGKNGVNKPSTIFEGLAGGFTYHI